MQKRAACKRYLGFQQTKYCVSETGKRRKQKQYLLKEADLLKKVFYWNEPLEKKLQYQQKILHLFDLVGIYFIPQILRHV